MAGELAPLERCLAAVGVSNGSEEAADVLLLLRAISDRVREMSGRPFEGTPTIYDQIIDVDWQTDFVLHHVPVSDILSIAPVHWDGTEDSILVPEPVEHDGVAGWSTNLAAPIAIGETNAKVDSVTGVLVGDHLFLATDEVVRVTTVGTAGAGGTGLDFEPAAKFAHASGATAKEVSGSTSWRLIDADRGKVELAGRLRFARVIWRTTGVVPPYIEQATVDWLKARWNERDREPGQTAYSTGDDSESWDPAMAGFPPPDVARSFGWAWHPSKQGVI